MNSKAVSMSITLTIFLTGTFCFPTAIAQCDIALNFTKGEFHSIDYPQHYPAKKCSYTIQAPSGYHIILNWQSFHVGLPKQNDRCPSDEVAVYNGRISLHQGRVTMCGYDGESVTSSGNILTVVLSGYSNRRYTGFLAKYFIERIKCASMTITTDIGMLSGPLAYPWDCLYTIQLASNRNVNFELLHHNVSLRSSQSACLSYVALYINNFTPKNEIYQFCFDHMFPPMYSSSSNIAFVRFRSKEQQNPFYGLTVLYRSHFVTHSSPTKKTSVPEHNIAVRIVLIIAIASVALTAICCSGYHGRKYYNRRIENPEEVEPLQQ
ncbi:CUB and zona pellucida-like domain-containing protein 1 [Trichoplax sp. H2]|nr:CUB and zona pellucida-like domain-containing protein 1 [Trichoplax sp. H2]|eukprot:RDD38347.1 CUB and zona pellucida-like domain-containing protein 1 [Trichoplax sp. H2]